jgi:hypothetical protein
VSAPSSTGSSGATGAGSQRGGPALAEALVVLGAFAVAGMLAGLVWALVTEPVQVTKSAAGVGIDEVELSYQFASDGWFVVVGGLTAVVLGAATTAWAVVRRRHLVGTVLLVLAGAALATVLMRATGRLAGPGDPEAALAQAPVGATAPAQLRVHASVADLTWLTSAMVGALAVLLSPLRRQP